MKRPFVHSFPKSARLLKPEEFNSLRDKSFSKGNRYFRLRWQLKSVVQQAGDSRARGARGPFSGRRTPSLLAGPAFSTTSLKENRRLGIVVSKKVAKANRRNLIKRIVREYFRLHPSLFPLGDVVVIANPVVGALTKKEIWEYLKDALSTSKKR
ncbi:MAG: ribonuclease P protein component [Deltaproteobacteria bacterium]|nr:ribonuclease P protein component [Deltaproteobacteria bacterium]